MLKFWVNVFKTLDHRHIIDSLIYVLSFSKPINLGIIQVIRVEFLKFRIQLLPIGYLNNKGTDQSASMQSDKGLVTRITFFRAL